MNPSWGDSFSSFALAALCLAPTVLAQEAYSPTLFFGTFGRTKTRKRVDGSSYTQPVPIDEWDTIIPDAHPGYITWQEYNDNLKTLAACAKAHGTDRRDHPPGEGPKSPQFC